MKSTILFVSFTLSLQVQACLWDRDTYAMEQRQFPSVTELISGQFLRHSEEFYQWRIKDRLKRVKANPDSLVLYDDLAVAYSKLHEDKKAIAVILRKDSIQPGLYKTYANLGTFYLHDRQIDNGIKYIQKAIDINPDAHFGREVYQLYLAKYIKYKMKEDRITLPLCVENSSDSIKRLSFGQFLEQQLEVRRLSATEQEKALKGIKGMMKFGNFDSPILLEVLGDVLAYEEYDEDTPRIIASMAYLNATRGASKEGRDLYRQKCLHILEQQIFKNNMRERSAAKLGYVEDLLIQENIKGKAKFNQIRNNEKRWIKQGLNPEVEFNKKYYSD